MHSYGQKSDTISIKTDNSDSLAFVVADTIPDKDSLKVKTKKDIETTIKYNAVDSIRLDVLRQMVFLYGQASINYGDITLTAENIEINWSTNLVVAKGDTDSTGKVFGLPVFKQGTEMYTSDVIKYNFKTKKGLISQVVTQQGEGYIHGQTVKRKDDQLFVSHAQYTTCNLKHPHFYINATKLKLIPDDKIVAGPFNLVISDIPTPLGFLLGIFPVPKKNKSGLIFPTYGENRDMGFFLSRGGWYFAINDYINAQVTGDIYSNGTYGIYGASGYRKRYKYGGNTGFNLFSQNIEQNDGTMVRASQYGIIWNHNTETKGTGNLSANVNVSSPNYYKVNSFNPNSRFANTFSSGVNYRKSFTGTPFNLNVAGRHLMDVNTKVQTVTLPDVVLSMNRIYPFKGKNSLGQKWYEKVFVGYNFNTKMTGDTRFRKLYKDPTIAGVDSGLAINANTLNGIIDGGTYYYQYNPATRKQEISKDRFLSGNNDSIILAGSQYGAFHSLPIGTSFKILKNFSLNPSLVWNEYWFPRRINYVTDEKNGKVNEVVENGFFRTHSFTGTGVTLTTNIYGQFNFKNSKLMAIRHTLTPTVGYSYSPDFTQPSYGSFQQIKNRFGADSLDIRGNRVKAPRFGRFTNLYGFPQGRESSAMSFSLNNVFQGKVRTPKDTVNASKKISILDRLSIGGNYDFLADSFNLSDFNIGANTNLFERFNLNFNTVFDPYNYEFIRESEVNKRKVREYRRTPVFSKAKGNGLGQFMYYNFSVNTSLNPDAFKKRGGDNVTKQAENFVQANPDLYIDFKIPWNIVLTYQATYENLRLKGFSTNSIQFSGDLSITENWKLTINSSYDILNKVLPGGNIGIVRDLHCWAMSLNVSQFGKTYTYFFNINAKSSLLQDLKLTKRSPNLMNTFMY